MTRLTTPSCWTSWSDDVGCIPVVYELPPQSTVHSRSYAIVSETVDLGCGLPQVSSLVVYAADLHAVTRHHNVRLHSFADDTQLYRHTTIRDVQLAKRKSVTLLQPLWTLMLGATHTDLSLMLRSLKSSD